MKKAVLAFLGVLFLSTVLAAEKTGPKEALQKKGQIAVFRLNPPFKFELEVNTSAQAELPTLIYLVKRTGPRTLEFSADDYLVGFKLLRALINLAGVS